MEFVQAEPKLRPHKSSLSLELPFPRGAKRWGSGPCIVLVKSYPWHSAHGVRRLAAFDRAQEHQACISYARLTRPPITAAYNSHVFYLIDQFTSIRTYIMAIEKDWDTMKVERQEEMLEDGLRMKESRSDTLKTNAAGVVLTPQPSDDTLDPLVSTRSQRAYLAGFDDD